MLQVACLSLPKTIFQLLPVGWKGHSSVAFYTLFLVQCGKPLYLVLRPFVEAAEGQRWNQCELTV